MKKIALAFLTLISISAFAQDFSQVCKRGIFLNQAIVRGTLKEISLKAKASSIPNEVVCRDIGELVGRTSMLELMLEECKSPFKHQSLKKEVIEIRKFCDLYNVGKDRSALSEKADIAVINLDQYYQKILDVYDFRKHVSEKPEKDCSEGVSSSSIRDRKDEDKGISILATQVSNQ